MKFLLFPNFRHTFEFRILDALRYALEKYGHQVHVSWRPTYPHVVSRMAKELSADVVFQVNRPRPVDEPLPKGVRHITWIQDARDDTMKTISESSLDGDIAYEMHPLEGLLGYRPSLPILHELLPPGVDRRIVDKLEPRPPAEEQFDFTMIGAMMQPMYADEREDMLAYEALNKTDYVNRKLARETTKRFSPKWILQRNEEQKEFDRRYSATIAKTAMELALTPFKGEGDYQKLEGIVAAALEGVEPLDRNSVHYRLTYSRLINRTTIARYILDLTDNVRFFGTDWKDHPEFQEYYGGYVHHQGQIVRINRSTKIVVHENPNGCNFHDRVLYAMGGAAFIMLPSSHWDNVAGGFGSFFLPDEHFGDFDHSTFHENARRWLSDEKARLQVAEVSRNEVLARHTYESRAERILADLER